MEQKKRTPYIDNTKAVLIALVVFGHLLESVSFSGKTMLYIAIYTFHMPAFVFLSGLCFKKGTPWVRKLLAPYLVYQAIYTFMVPMKAAQHRFFSLRRPFGCCGICFP